MGEAMGNDVIKSGHREPFTVLYKSAIRDKRLTFEMLGFLTYMLDKPPEWEFTVSGMAKERGVGLGQVRRLVGLLEDVGYLMREQSHDDGGRFAKNVYVLQETPPLSGFPDNGEPLKLPLSENTDNGENRCRENPSTDLRTQSKNVETKDYIIPPYNPPKGNVTEKPKRRRSAKTVPDWKPERFEGFWAYYPRGENRMGAVRAWDKLKPDDALIETIGRALQTLKASEAWREGYGIPYASTFLNQRRWEDAAAKRPPVHSSKATPARRLAQPPDGEDGAWTWSE